MLKCSVCDCLLYYVSLCNSYFIQVFVDILSTLMSFILSMDMLSVRTLHLDYCEKYLTHVFIFHTFHCHLFSSFFARICIDLSGTVFIVSYVSFVTSLCKANGIKPENIIHICQARSSKYGFSKLYARSLFDTARICWYSVSQLCLY